MTSGDIGLVIGTILVLSFGATIAVVVPYFINRHAKEEELPLDRAKMILWLRVMGSIVVVVTIIELVLMWTLD